MNIQKSKAFVDATTSFNQVADLERNMSLKKAELESVVMRVASLEFGNADKDTLHRARTKRTAVERDITNLVTEICEAKKQSYAANLLYLYEAMA